MEALVLNTLSCPANLVNEKRYITLWKLNVPSVTNISLTTSSFYSIDFNIFLYILYTIFTYKYYSMDTQQRIEILQQYGSDGYLQQFGNDKTSFCLPEEKKQELLEAL
jgi:hypothetical protein